MPEYTLINRAFSMAEFCICLMWYIALGHCTDCWTIIKIDAFSEHCLTFKMEHFAKRKMTECG